MISWSAQRLPGARSGYDAASADKEPCDRGQAGSSRNASSSVDGTIEIDGKDYLTNASFSSGLKVLGIQDSLAYAYTCSPMWRKVADAAASRGTGIRWDTVSSETNGMFDPDQNMIVLNSELRSERPIVIAATIAHETYHASHEAPSDVGSTLQDEINAYGWEAYVWSQFTRSAPTTAREAFLDKLVKLWQSRELNNFVVTMPGYQRNLFGRVLESP